MQSYVAGCPDHAASDLSGNISAYNADKKLFIYISIGYGRL